MNKYVECAVCEIEEKSFAVTQQYLEVNSILKVNGEYAIERIHDVPPEDIVVYFRITGERYFFGVRVDRKKIEVTQVFIENGNNCYLRVSSKNHSLKELADYTQLTYTSGYSKGDAGNFGTARYENTLLRFELLDSECYSTEVALKLLLDKLEPHKTELAELSKKSFVRICIQKHQYVSGDLGLYLDVAMLKRLADLNLDLDIDPYICGNPI